MRPLVAIDEKGGQIPRQRRVVRAITPRPDLRPDDDRFLMKKKFLAILLVCFVAAPASPADTAIPNPILFVTQVPQPGDFTTITSTFGNHSGQIDSVPRGGDLWIRYPDGTLRNLTRAAGFGMQGQQGANAIAVRDPSVHWSGTKALFSMVIGAPQQYQWNDYYWQIYEITGLGATDTPVIRRIANQPPDYNNITPIYATGDDILFTSDRPRNGARHLCPQLDEYEEAPTVTGIWRLDPASGELRILNHSPSGVFSPSIDSFGRVIFTRWDHLQRDQQADADALDGARYGTFDYADESAAAARLNQRVEVFPEPRSSRTDLLAGTNLEGLSINHFFPWEINEDGTAEETLNHIGRHELHRYFNRSVNDDAGIVEFTREGSGRTNQNDIDNLFQIREDPTRPGRYFGVDAPEFETHASGQIVSLIAEPARPADQIEVTYVTARSTRYVPDGPPEPGLNGHYRDPLPLSSGALLAVHTGEVRADANDGTRAHPTSRYAFRIRTIEGSEPGAPLTPGISASVSYWDPDVLVTWSGLLWELQPVEVRARPRPVPRVAQLEEPEAKIFREEGVDPEAFRRSLAARNLALVVSRDVTARDAADRQQPFHLRVAGTGSPGANGARTYDVAYMQFFQADQLRGIGGTESPRAGRRVLARAMHDPAVKNPPSTGAQGSVTLAADGSMAAFVPAQRAMSWQSTDRNDTPVVRERYWLTFQAGEVRVCHSCHGVNTRDQLQRTPPQNSPEALRTLLKFWKSGQEPAKKRAVRK
jgi:Hydrazine synthase alpha subunit middle domain